MKAAVITEFKKPLEVQDLPDPKPGPGDAVVWVEACGVCRSDWHLWQHHWTWLGIEMELPRVMGHEFGGVVEEVGSAVKQFSPGDRVTVPFHLACGHCDHCRMGRSNLCMAYGVIGVHHDGGYGAYAMVPQADSTLLHLPEEIDSLTAAALGCRYMTSYHGIADRVRVRPGEWVAVFGMGGVGLSAVQIASALGARPIAVSRTQSKLDKAKELGAEATVQAGDDTVEAIKEITGGGADVSVDAVSSSETTVQGLLSLTKGGRHLQLGMTGGEEEGQIALPVDLMTMLELEFYGSVGCPSQSYAGLFGLISSGKVTPTDIVEKTISVEEVSQVLQEMTGYNTQGFNVINSWD